MLNFFEKKKKSYLGEERNLIEDIFQRDRVLHPNIWNWMYMVGMSNYGMRVISNCPIIT